MPASPALHLQRRKGKGFFAEPYGWHVEGVIAPLQMRGRTRPVGLVCTVSGLIIVQRTFSGFWSPWLSAGLGFPPAIGSDSIETLAAEAIDVWHVYTRAELIMVTFRQRATRHEIRVATAQETLPLYVYARSAIDGYRHLLRRCYPSIYIEPPQPPGWRFSWR